MAEYGEESWELDALNPQYLVDLIQRHIHKYIDTKKWDASLDRQYTHEKELKQFIDKFHYTGEPK